MYGLVDRHGNLVNNGKVSEEGGILVSQVYSPEIELTRRGNGLSAVSTSAVAALVARPTTLAMVTLANDEPAGGKSYIMESAFAFNLVSTALAEGASIWLCVHPVGSSEAITDNISARGNLTGKPVVNPGHSKFGTEDTVLDDGWFPWGPHLPITLVGVTPSGAIVAPIDGKIIIPPLARLSMQVVAGLTTDTFTAGFRWYEEQMEVNTG